MSKAAYDRITRNILPSRENKNMSSVEAGFAEDKSLRRVGTKNTGDIGWSSMRVDGNNRMRQNNDDMENGEMKKLLVLWPDSQDQCSLALVPLD